MASTSTPSSFIPKRGPKRAKRIRPARRIFLFTLIAYSLVFAALIASAASYLYKNYVTTTLQNEVTLLSSQIDTFNESRLSELSALQDYDLKLQRAAARFNNSASVVTALDAIDEVTADPIQIINLTFEREGDEYVTIVAQLAAQSFDAALFQRQLLRVGDGLFSRVQITDVSTSVEGISEDSQNANNTNLSVEQPVTFTATLEVPVQSLGYVNTNVQTNNETNL